MMRDAIETGCHPTIDDFVYAVKSLLKQKGQLSRLTNNKLENEWILGFLDRHKGINLKPGRSFTNSDDKTSSSNDPSKMVLLDGKEVFLDCSVKKENDVEEKDINPEEAFHNALVDVKVRGMNVFTAARMHKVSSTTLWEATYLKDVNNGVKVGSILTRDEEQEVNDMHL